MQALRAFVGSLVVGSRLAVEGGQCGTLQFMGCARTLPPFPLGLPPALLGCARTLPPFPLGLPPALLGCALGWSLSLAVNQML